MTDRADARVAGCRRRPAPWTDCRRRRRDRSQCPKAHALDRWRTTCGSSPLGPKSSANQYISGPEALSRLRRIVDELVAAGDSGAAILRRIEASRIPIRVFRRPASELRSRRRAACLRNRQSDLSFRRGSPAELRMIMERKTRDRADCTPTSVPCTGQGRSTT